MELNNEFIVCMQGMICWLQDSHQCSQGKVKCGQEFCVGVMC